MTMATAQQQGDRATALWQCRVCGTVYDPRRGDPDSGIAAGTPFDELPDGWACPVCGAEKADFDKIEPGTDYDDAAVGR